MTILGLEASAWNGQEQEKARISATSYASILSNKHVKILTLLLSLLCSIAYALYEHGSEGTRRNPGMFLAISYVKESVVPTIDRNTGG